ncbi:cytochrome C55X precursor NirC [Thalassotalea sp. 42_200_T64]|nr:cytochrome C55X precursor NirC [Thalassotalea sp. 42_200_T64]
MAAPSKSVKKTAEQTTSSTALTKQRKNDLLHLVKQDCGSCHGMTLKGGLGPALLPADLVNKPEYFLTITILEGRPGTAMPPWKDILSEQEAQWIAAQLLQGLDNEQD